MSRLVVNPGTPQAWEIQLKPGINRLGRSSTNEVVIQAPGISSTHCQIVVDDQAVMIRDLGSTNGTFVERAPVQEARLEDGQMVQLGSVEMAFHSEPPESLAPIEMPAPPPLAFVQAGPRFCVSHPKAPARHVCGHCHRVFCDACVSIRHEQGRVGKFCRSCSVECVPLNPGPIPVAEPKRTFAQRVPAALLYPLRGDGFILLFTGGLLYLLMDGAGIVSRFAGMVGVLAIVFLTVLGSGYLVAYMRRIVTSSAAGENTLPDWPDLSDLGSDIILPFLQLAGTVAISFAPAIVLTIFPPEDSPWVGGVVIASVLIGCFYFPMAFTAVAMFDSVTAVNPLLVIPSILKIPLAYLSTVMLFAAVLILRWLGHTFLPRILPVPILSWSICSFLGLYLLIVEMRILGLLYWTKKDELAWFNR
jgi:hypothetical protein